MYGASSYINGAECSIIQHRFCFHNCSVGYSGQHSRCHLGNLNTECLNYVEESNNASTSSIIGLYNGNFKVEYCNILNNFCLRGCGIVAVYGDATLNGCSLLGNFGNGYTLYCYDLSSFTVINSFYDNLTIYESIYDRNENNQKTSKYNSLDIYHAYLCDLFFIFLNTNTKDIKCSLKECFYRNDIIGEFVVVLISNP